MKKSVNWTRPVNDRLKEVDTPSDCRAYDCFRRKETPEFANAFNEFLRGRASGLEVAQGENARFDTVSPSVVMARQVNCS